MTEELFFHICGVVVVASPLLLIAILGIPPLIGRPLSEGTINRFTYAAVNFGLLAASLILIGMLVTGRRHVPIELGHWIELEELHFHFHLKFVFDRLSVPFVILTFLLCGTIGALTSG